MNKKQNIPSALGLTVILAAILFGIILLLISFMAWFGYMGVKTGRISPLFLIEKPSVMIMVICVISLILGIVIMSIVQKLLIGPIGEMTKAMRQLAEGNFETRVPLSAFRPREIVTFTESFNKTAETLSSVEILRSDFINNFSHEFKTPINSLVGIAELLKSGDCSPEETEEYLDIIIDQSKRLASLSSNVLYLTKLETGASSVEMDTLNLSELLRQVLVMFDYKCSEKDLDLEVGIDSIELTGSADLLTQMMGNILDNAIKFSAGGSSIEVELSAQEDHAVFKVTDHGCGMDQETVGRIFDKFYQGDTSHSAEGFGLGLPMVKKIVELHRGRLVVESQTGKGSVFTIELPLKSNRQM
ncbi:MAG: ATP-binding protein [Oscillospiraceae bacterium]